MDLIIKRSKWLRGTESKYASYLLHPVNRRMCCLGFLARAVGYKPCNIQGIHTPKSVGNVLNKFPTTIVSEGDNTMLCHDMMSVNDDDKMTDTQRERKLIRLFKKAKIAITFVD